MNDTPETPETPEPHKPINHAGRKGLWHEGMIEEAYLYCLEHYGTDRDLANHLGIAYGTIYDYKERYPEFAEAIKRGRKRWRQNGCGSVVQSLYRSAEQQVLNLPKVREKKVLVGGQMVTVERVVTMEQHVCWPSQRAMEMILLNQAPEDWKRSPDDRPSEDPVTQAAQVLQAMDALKAKHQVASEGD